MDMLTLLARLKGEILANKARAVVDGQLVVLGRLTESGWEYTEKGKSLADLHSNLVVEETPPAKTRKSRAPAVESVEAPAEAAPAAEPAADQ
jgi:hypothetical protein